MKTKNKHFDLIVFLAQCVSKMENARLEALSCKNFDSMRDKISLQFPIVQGIHSQRQIDEIAKLEFDGNKAWEQSVEFLKSALSKEEK